MTRGRGHGLSRRAVLLVVLAALLAFAFQGSRGLYETTEGRYAESAREMLETGDWLVPRLDYEPHWTKPPLTYWALAGGMALLGENEWGVRAAPAVAYLVVVAAVFGLGAAMWGRRTALRRRAGLRDVSLRGRRRQQRLDRPVPGDVGGAHRARLLEGARGRTRGTIARGVPPLDGPPLALRRSRIPDEGAARSPDTAGHLRLPRLALRDAPPGSGAGLAVGHPALRGRGVRLVRRRSA